MPFQYEHTLQFTSVIIAKSYFCVKHIDQNNFQVGQITPALTGAKDLFDYIQMEFKAPFE